MSYRPTTNADEVLTLIENLVTHTRPAAEAELIQALNFGMGKVTRALLSVRPQAFLSYVDPFALVSGQAEYDLGRFSPTIMRPVRLTALTGAVPSIIFRYRAFTDPEFEARDGQGGGTTGLFFYDVFSGQFPQKAHAYVQRLSSGFFLFASPSERDDFPIGTAVLLPNAGAAITAGEPGTTLHQDLFSTVVAHDNVIGSLQIANVPTTDSGGYGSIPTQAIVPLWRRVLRLAPTPATPYQGRLYYDAEPQRVIARTEPLHDLIVRYQDCVVEYAMSQLLKVVSDAMHRDHLEAANDLRAELIQEQEPLSGQNTESISSGLGDD